jgi:hypothetical protein
MIEIAGLPVPEAFVRAARANLISEGVVLRPVDGVDAYELPLSPTLAHLYFEPATLMRATSRVAIGFEADSWYGARTPDVAGAIADITDFSRILCFGFSAEGEPFCFDFRDDLERPSVICWDGEALAWRRIAPDAETFLRIFSLSLRNS